MKKGFTFIFCMLFVACLFCSCEKKAGRTSSPYAISSSYLDFKIGDNLILVSKKIISSNILESLLSKI
ncbi:MAG: hypothetical protein LBD61_03735 [Endomicrobium sp.]|jgi:hypothetical protein|nr:hypothetical protein [Endomicrobium sp.]